MKDGQLYACFDVNRSSWCVFESEGRLFSRFVCRCDSEEEAKKIVARAMK